MKKYTKHQEKSTGHKGKDLGGKKETVRISQCLIVKNEEENISAALSWGKGIVSEQIVVDTGSTDRTAVIAEQMGAKVYPYEWHDDFSAAKNYAIGHATGDWIAFLDADEYFTKESAQQLPVILDMIDRADLPSVRKPNIVSSRMVHLDDAGNVATENIQDRVFRNTASIRYQNRIHECLTMKEPPGLIRFEGEGKLTIVHTGYSESTYQRTDKLGRNVRMLLKELEEHPGDISLLSYLGDCYVSMDEMEKAQTVFRQILLTAPEGLKGDKRIFHAAAKMLEIMVTDSAGDIEEKELTRIYGIAAVSDSTHPDPDYFMGLQSHRAKQPARTITYLERSLDKAEGYKGLSPVVMTGNKLVTVYDILLEVSANSGDKDRTVKYAVLSLKADRYQTDVMVLLIHIFFDVPGSQAEMEGFLAFLEKIYSFGNLKDKLFLLKCTKLSGAKVLEEAIRGLFTDKELEWLASK